MSNRRPEFWSIRDEYLYNHGEYCAAIAFAKDLMEDDPENFKSGYTRENAIYAAIEVFPEAVYYDWETEIPDA